jgi:hypothetical protein
MNTIVLNVGINGSVESMVKMDRSLTGAPNVKHQIGIEMQLALKRMAFEDA